MSEVAHKRRRLEVKQRKWTKEEISTILDYIEETADFECPTAQAYYKKLLEKYEINASWDLVRFKVRHLRLKLKKAMEVLRAERACLSESDDCFDLAKKIYKICPEYSRLLKLFASKTATEDDILPELSTLDGSMSVLFNDDDTIIMEDTGDEEYETVKSEEYVDPLRENSVKNNERTLHKTNATLVHSNQSKVMGNDISKSYIVPGRSVELQKLQYEFEKEKYNKQLELKERQLQLEEDKHNTEKEYKNRLLEIKLFQIERDERLKTLELERDERLRKLELEKDERLRKLELQRDERLEMSKIENMRVT